MPRGKDISGGLRGATVAARQPGEDYEAGYEQCGVQSRSVREIIHKYEALKTAARLPGGGTSQKIYPKVRPHDARRNATSLQTSLCTVNIKEE